jgi:hypothetical protein
MASLPGDLAVSSGPASVSHSHLAVISGVDAISVRPAPIS